MLDAMLWACMVRSYGLGRSQVLGSCLRSIGGSRCLVPRASLGHTRTMQSATRIQRVLTRHGRHAAAGTLCRLCRCVKLDAGMPCGSLHLLLCTQRYMAAGGEDNTMYAESRARLQRLNAVPSKHRLWQSPRRIITKSCTSGGSRTDDG
jgi:hypothetical protein